MNKTTHFAAVGALPHPKPVQHSNVSLQEILLHLQVTVLSLSYLPQCWNADGCTTIHFLLPRSSSYTPPLHFSTPTPAPVFHSSTIQYLLSSLASACTFFKLKTWRLPFIIIGIMQSLLFTFWVWGSQNKGSIQSFYYWLSNSFSELLIKFSRLHKCESTHTSCTALFLHIYAQWEYKHFNRTKSSKKYQFVLRERLFSEEMWGISASPVSSSFSEGICFGYKSVVPRSLDFRRVV